jgi:hypothetical protein
MRFSFSLSAAVPRGNWGVSGGGQIPPVLVGWVDAAETDLLAGSDVAGSTVANPGMVNGTKNIRTGAIALNSGIYEDYSSGEGGGRTRVNLITHEVGHLLGLDHSSEGIMRAAVDEKAVAGFTQTEITFLRDNMPACGRDMPTP